MTAARESLFGLPALILSTAGVLAGIFLSIPDDLEMGHWHSLSFDSLQAEKLLRQSVRKNPSSAMAVRNLSELLERRGQPREAIEWLKHLTLLRPKNEGYWKKLIEMLTWEGEDLDAVSTKEMMLKSGAAEWSVSSLRDLANDYHWLQKYSDARRIYEQMWQRNLYEEEDIDEILRSFFSSRQWGKAERFAFSAVEQKHADHRIHQKLVWAFNDIGQPQNATRHLAYYLGTPKDLAELAWENTRFLDALSPAQLKAETPMLNDLVWIYTNKQKSKLAIDVLRRLYPLGLLDNELNFTYVELLIEHKQNDEALDVLISYCKRSALSLRGWRRAAQHFMRLEQSMYSSKILEALLDGRTPTSEDFR